MAPTAEQLGIRAVQLSLMTERQLQAAWGEIGTKNVPLEEFTNLLIRRELLTNYQVERLVEGRTTGFFFGDYKALYLVGRGTFARVYRAVHRETGEVVAIKVLRTKYSENQESCTQFQREGELGKVLNHPNIIQIKEVYSRGKLHFLAMEFIEGQSLADFVRLRGKVAYKEAVSIMKNIVSGLQYAFEHGMTHRDLKLTNVMVTSRGVAKLADFGLAQVDQNLQLDDMVIEIPNPRTLDYAGLENATGVKKDDTRSDIYFAGCMFYHMLTGESPLLETKDRIQRISSNRFREVVPVQEKMPSLPLAIAMVVNKAMNLDVHKRYQTPGEFLRDLKLIEQQIHEHPEKILDQSVLLGNRSLVEHSVMIVESDPKLQEILRESFKKVGFRVLLTTDPQRAIDRFYDDRHVADCMVINAQNIGMLAVEGFNSTHELDHGTWKLPAFLLLAKNQKSWNETAVCDDFRVVVQMPVSMKQLTILITQVLAKRAK
ncbi:MAG: serine/threonine-protein kinase [Planctomycetia bacterium]|nr:serine/threonine-protein kinase [Planctomycetia bacterium]